MPWADIVATTLASWIDLPTSACARTRPRSRFDTNSVPSQKTSLLASCSILLSASTLLMPSPSSRTGRVATTRYSRNTCPLVAPWTPETPPRAISVRAVRWWARDSSVAYRSTFVSTKTVSATGVTVDLLATPRGVDSGSHRDQHQIFLLALGGGHSGRPVEDVTQFSLQRTMVSPGKPFESRQGVWGNIPDVNRFHTGIIMLPSCWVKD